MAAEIVHLPAYTTNENHPIDDKSENRSMCYT